MNLKSHFDQEIKSITDQIIKNYKPEKIILFGSCARGNPTESSDIDLLIVKQTKKNRLERTKEVFLFVDHTLPFEPIILTPQEVKSRYQANDYFLQDALKEGEVIYDSKAKHR